MTADRANVVARTLLAIVRQHITALLNSPALHSELAAYLRDEFADTERQTMSDLRS